MIRMEDIYYNVDSYIIDNNFYKADIEEKKALVDFGLKRYLSQKIHQINGKKQLSDEELTQVDFNELVELLGEMIPESQHSQTLEHVVRYLIGSISLVQGRKLKWIRENDEELIDSVHFEFNDKQQMTTMTTHVNPSYPVTIRFIYDIYRSGILHQKGKEYKKKKEQ